MLPRRRSGASCDPPPATPLGWLGRLWVLGCVAVLVVVVLTLLSGPGDLSVPRRVFVWVSTAAFSAWLLRQHRRRLSPSQRMIVVGLCGGALVILFLALSSSAF